VAITEFISHTHIYCCYGSSKKVKQKWNKIHTQCNITKLQMSKGTKLLRVNYRQLTIHNLLEFRPLQTLENVKILFHNSKNEKMTLTLGLGSGSVTVRKCQKMALKNLFHHHHEFISTHVKHTCLQYMKQ